MSRISQERAMYPLAKAAAQPAITGSAPIEDETSPKSFSSRINAPKIAGIETINENSPATSRLTPQKENPQLLSRFLKFQAKFQFPARAQSPRTVSRTEISKKFQNTPNVFFNK